MPEKRPHLTTREFAERTGISVSTVSQYLRDGKIKGKKESGRWMIPEDQIGRVEAGGATPPQKKSAEKPPLAPKSPPAGKKTYTVEEFSRLTFLTPAGVVKYLKAGILSGRQAEDGHWEVAADNLESARIRHLIR
ncbi:MAG: helix-turn-helix domain-containing protein [Desulfobacterales bacterium]|jgi:excisionase family DNA binding protein